MSKRKIQELKKQFSLRRGTTVKGIPAQVVGEELTSIYAEHGRLTGKVVVEAARPEAAKLHPVFEWNDEVAGELWREFEARSLIKVVQVDTKSDEGKPVVTPVFYHIPAQGEEEKGSYHTTDVVISRPDLLLMALTSLRTQMAAVERAIDTLTLAANQKGDQDLTARIGIAALAFAAAREAVAALH
ncbi:MAG: hypothetical protein WAS33_18560 [Candidatus Promineifilaceae bacterium]